MVAEAVGWATKAGCGCATGVTRLHDRAGAGAAEGAAIQLSESCGSCCVAMIQTDVLSEGGVQCIVIEIDIIRSGSIFSAEIMALEPVEENGVEIGVGGLDRVFIRLLRKVLLVKAPGQFVGGIH